MRRKLPSRAEAQAAYNLRKSQEAYDERTQDARAWRDHWRARAAEERMQDEGDMLVRPVINWRVLLRAALYALVVYVLLTAAGVLYYG